MPKEIEETNVHRCIDCRKLYSELKDTSNDIENAVQQALDKAADILIAELERNSPSNSNSKKKHYREGWIKKGNKDSRYVGNTKTVKGPNGEDIPLSILLEYGSENCPQGKPHISNSYHSVEEEIYTLVADSVEKALAER